MTDPNNHDGEPEDNTSSGEPDAAETDLDSTDAESTEEDVADSEDAVEPADDAESDDVADPDADSDSDDDGDDERERKEKPVAAGKASRSGNPARAAEADAEDEPRRSTRPVKPKKIGNRWAAPAMLACAGIGLLWIVLYYVFANRDNPIPVMSDLGDWNLIIGMGFIVAAFGFSMKWE